MNIFKDLMRVVALVLIACAVYKDSVACAISAGTLYLGGFDSTLHLRQILRLKQNEQAPPVPNAVESSAHNVIHLRR